MGDLDDREDPERVPRELLKLHGPFERRQTVGEDGRRHQLHDHEGRSVVEGPAREHRGDVGRTHRPERVRFAAKRFARRRVVRPRDLDGDHLTVEGALGQEYGAEAPLTEGLSNPEPGQIWRRDDVGLGRVCRRWRRRRRRAVGRADGRGVWDAPTAGRTTNHRTSYPSRGTPAKEPSRMNVGRAPTSSPRRPSFVTHLAPHRRARARA